MLATFASRDTREGAPPLGRPAARCGDDRATVELIELSRELPGLQAHEPGARVALLVGLVSAEAFGQLESMPEAVAAELFARGAGHAAAILGVA